MTLQQSLLDPSIAITVDARMSGITKLVVMAVGGQGGGVVAGWIEDLARAGGYAAQATSVAGVAQRTGATVYYIEMCKAGDRQPIFSLMPAAGDVDILIASEMMEVGRSILRGFVTPDRTTLIGSTHRALAVSEKMVPGDGIANAAEVVAAAEIAAQKLVLADFEALAIGAGSVISASLFGGLAGSGALPFPREAFEAAIRASGKGVDASLRAFAAGFEAVTMPQLVLEQGTAPVQAATPRGPAALMLDWDKLSEQVRTMPAPLRDMVFAGLRKVVDFQSVAYGAVYLGHVRSVLGRDDAAHGYALSLAAAKYMANAMAYDDVIRVADLKTRAGRFDRIKGEMGAKDANVMQVTEFMHPRAEEIAGMLPAKFGARIEASPKWMARLDRWFGKGRRLRTDGLMAFVTLHFLGSLRGYRLRTLRHRYEMDHLARWLSLALQTQPQNYDLAVEIIRCRRLVKGYSDTHARGLSKFDRVLAGIDLVKHRDDAADWARRLREAALLDEEGRALDGALSTIRTFT
jgi:indolepyruvate ferredoxin oxidoreductase, beta subunit